MMATRYRWYRIQFPDENMDFLSLVTEIPFINQRGYGFSSNRDEFGDTAYRFIYRTNLTITTVDEDGTLVHKEIPSTDFIDFTLLYIGMSVFMRVVNPGRSIRDLLNALESQIGLGFVCKPITFSKIQPTEIFTDNYETKLVGLKVSGMVDNDLGTKIEITSTDGMSIENIKLLNEIRYTLTSAVLEVLFEGIRGQVTITATGLVKISGKLKPKLLGEIEKQLLTSG